MEESTKKEKALFIMRAILWFVFAGVLPFIFISLQFGVYSNAEPKLKLNGIVYFGLIVLIAVAMKLAKYLYQGMSIGIAKQCLHGAFTIIAPLLILFAILNGLTKISEDLEKVLGIIIVCETIAIPIDPFPVWLVKKKAGKFENLIDLGIDKVFRRLKDGDK